MKKQTKETRLDFWAASIAIVVAAFMFGFCLNKLIENFSPPVVEEPTVRSKQCYQEFGEVYEIKGKFEYGAIATWLTGSHKDHYVYKRLDEIDRDYQVDCVAGVVKNAE